MTPSVQLARRLLADIEAEGLSLADMAALCPVLASAIRAEGLHTSLGYVHVLAALRLVPQLADLNPPVPASPMPSP